MLGRMLYSLPSSFAAITLCAITLCAIARLPVPAWQRLSGNLVPSSNMRVARHQGIRSRMEQRSSNRHSDFQQNSRRIFNGLADPPQERDCLAAVNHAVVVG